MGKKGREIVRLNIEELIEDLTRAYADEWLAHYYYTLAANLLQGINSPEIAEKLRESSLSEYGHSNKLAERIMELGGEPPRAFAEVAQRAACPPFNIPRNPSDIPALINSVLEQERHAIETYQALAEKTQHGDHVTYDLVRAILTDEVQEEEMWENILGS